MTEEGTKNALKYRHIAEILACYVIFVFCNVLLNWVSKLWQIDGLWVGIAIYFIIVCIISLYVVKVEKKHLSSIGLKSISIKEIFVAIILGIIMFIVQQIPLLMMGIDYKMYAVPPDWGFIVIMSVYCIFCVGFAEEMMMRGFILHKSMQITNSKIIVVLFNCIIFYAIHWPPVRFVFGEVFNVALNTIILCVYLFCSKKKSITPLIISHGVYDIFSAYLLPAFAYLLLG